MPQITLPDGSIRVYDEALSALDVACDIGKRLGADALGCVVDGELRDLSTILDRDCALGIVTPKTRDGKLDDNALALIRHSAAHVMAEAIQRVVPGALLVYGPAVESGFYYDIRFPEDRALREGDFERVESEMAKIIAEDRPFTRYELSVVAGFEKLKQEKSKYKVDNANRAAQGGAQSLSWYVTGTPQVATEIDEQTKETIREAYMIGDRFYRKKSEEIPALLRLTKADEFDSFATAYFVSSDPLELRPGAVPDPNWEDLCQGPHVPSTGRIGAVKIMSLASSYWHGDENSDRLTRVYGIAFATQKDLNRHLNQLEEAKKRDHRVLGKKLKLFHIDEAVGQGLVLWLPAGAVIRKELQDFIGEELRKQGYHDVFTPHIGKLGLYRTSGHFPYYADSQYTPVMDREFIDGLASEGCSCGELSNRLGAGEVEGYLLKPMNCPHHIKIFDSQPHSYRDLPVRLSEFGTVYRWEQSGELNGMTRVRSFTVDDAHIFCREDQVAQEVMGCLSLVKVAFETLGLKDFRVRVGLRDPDSGKYVGKGDVWDKAETACIEAARSLGTEVSEEPGEAAFYGPKIDFIVRDVIGREWQLGTVQVDYNLPERFDLSYIGSDNTAHRPVMIHRAPFGSFERFVAVLIEHFEGRFPLWLSPEQVRVLAVSEKSAEYANTVLEKLKGARVRATADLSGDRLQAKIKVASDELVPYLLIVGPRDEENQTVSVRARGIQKDLGAVSLERFRTLVVEEILTKGVSSAKDAIVG